MLKEIFEWFLQIWNYINLIGGIALLTLIVKYWKNIKLFFAKLKYKLFPVNFDIAISIKFENGLNSGQYFKQLIKNFENIFKENGLDSKLKIKNYTDIKIFDTDDEAKSFVKKNQINLLIWGEFSIDNLRENSEIMNSLIINFTYLYPGKLEFDNLINLDISTNLDIPPQWKIFENNSMSDLKLISKDLVSISLYIIAISLKLFRYIELSTELLEKIRNNKDLEVNFKNAVNFHLMNNYDFLVINLIRINQDFIKAEEYANKMLEILPNSIQVLNNLALCKFKNGNVNEAEKIIMDLYNRHPKLPLNQISYAYVCVRRKNYKIAYRMYQKFFKHDSKDLGFEPMDVINYLYEEFNTQKDPAFLYGSAVLNYCYKDMKIAKKDFKRFLRIAEKNTMIEMVNNAKNLLNNKNKF